MILGVGRGRCWCWSAFSEARLYILEVIGSWLQSLEFIVAGKITGDLPKPMCTEPYLGPRPLGHSINREVPCSTPSEYGKRGP